MISDNMSDDDGLRPGDLDQARAELIQAIDDAGAEHALPSEGQDGSIVKADNGLSFELRLNGVTLPLAGNDVSELPSDDFGAFLEEQKLKIQSGEFDDLITSALERDGPGKVVARVRALANGA